MPILSLRYITVFPSPFSCALQISPNFLTNTAESLIAYAPLRDFVHLVSDPPRMLGSILCRVECCWQREKLASPRVNGEFHTVH
ncbi:hypothetical protein L218DRAFT_953939 [Marasmius fiardii PR-910]|nr:hypothetical protein L218DRAFT_953939 [Marasmius fiardii PR-910]